MSSKKLQIVHIASEVEPFSKTGGLADVASSLPQAIAKQGHEVIVITPLYDGVISKTKYNLKQVAKDIKIELSEGVNIEADFWQGRLENGIKTYFVENNKYFGKRKSLYGSKHENARFFFFDLAAVNLIKKIKFKPDIIHCHDWHTGLVPYFIKKRFQKDEFFSKTATVFTIHNLLFQFGHNWWKVKSNLKDDGKARLPKFGHTPAVERINFVKRAIINTDVLNTVSEQYAQEILTKNFGQDLHRILKNREDKLFGIVNGIDYKDFNPKTDPGIYRNYDTTSLNKKEKNKTYIQKYFKLPQKPRIPLLGMVTRITEQKGFDLVLKILEDILRLDIQFLIMGSGDKTYEDFFKKMEKKYPEKIGIHLEFDAKRATSIYAGTDMFLMPSRFEPCGLGQLISLRYGSIPIVRSVGGLADTVTDFDPQTGKGNGFVFHNYSAKALLIAIIRAIENYKYSEVWDKLVKNGMNQVFSWEIPAKKYLTLYRKAIILQHNNSNGKNGKK